MPPPLDLTQIDRPMQESESESSCMSEWVGGRHDEHPRLTGWLQPTHLETQPSIHSRFSSCCCFSISLFFLLSFFIVLVPFHFNPWLDLLFLLPSTSTSTCTTTSLYLQLSLFYCNNQQSLNRRSFNCWILDQTNIQSKHIQSSNIQSHSFETTTFFAIIQPPSS